MSLRPKETPSDHIDYVPCNVKSPDPRARLVLLEDNEAVIKMTIKQRSPTLAYITRTHRVSQDWMFERIEIDPAISIKYVNTKEQIADMMTKGVFTTV